MAVEVGKRSANAEVVRCPVTRCSQTLTPGVAGLQHAYDTNGWHLIEGRGVHVTCSSADLPHLHRAIRASCEGANPPLRHTIWVPSVTGAWLVGIDLAELNVLDRALVALIEARPGWSARDAAVPGSTGPRGEPMWASSKPCIRAAVLEAENQELEIAARAAGAAT
jgi:hypothetical protein